MFYRFYLCINYLLTIRCSFCKNGEEKSKVTFNVVHSVVVYINYSVSHPRGVVNVRSDCVRPGFTTLNPRILFTALKYQKCIRTEMEGEEKKLPLIKYLHRNNRGRKLIILYQM